MNLSDMCSTMFYNKLAQDMKEARFSKYPSSKMARIGNILKIGKIVLFYLFRIMITMHDIFTSKLIP